MSVTACSDKKEHFTALFKNITGPKCLVRELKLHESHLENFVSEKTQALIVVNEQHKAQVTECLPAKESPAKNEEKYRNFFEANQDAITIFRINADNTPSTFLDMNKAAI